MTTFERVKPNEIEALSALATAIVKEHFDPIIGAAQNDYMIAKFQTPEAIREQIDAGSRYYWIRSDARVPAKGALARRKNVGFFAFYPDAGQTRLSKLYVARDFRGAGLASAALGFIEKETRAEGLDAIVLNVNRDNLETIAIYRRLGFSILREEKNDIGGGFFMDDCVMIKDLGRRVL